MCAMSERNKICSFDRYFLPSRPVLPDILAPKGAPEVSVGHILPTILATSKSGPDEEIQEKFRVRAEFELHSVRLRPILLYHGTESFRGQYARNNVVDRRAPPSRC